MDFMKKYKLKKQNSKKPKSTIQDTTLKFQNVVIDFAKWDSNPTPSTSDPNLVSPEQQQQAVRAAAGGEEDWKYPDPNHVKPRDEAEYQRQLQDAWIQLVRLLVENTTDDNGISTTRPVAEWVGNVEVSARFKLNREV